MGRTWTKVETVLPRHPKTKALARLWQTHPYMVCGFLLATWDYMLEHQPDGNLFAVPDAELEELAKPCLERAVGVVDVPRDVLVTSGWVERDGYWHDWNEYAGALVERRAKERDRKCNYRNQKTIASESVPRDKRGTTRGRPTPKSRVDNNSGAHAPTDPTPAGPVAQSRAQALRDQVANG